MGCILVLALLGMPRIGLLWLWFAHTGYVQRAMGGSELFPILGFLFLPTTTLAYAYSINGLGGGAEMTPFGWFLVVIGLAVDLGLHGASGRSGRRQVARGTPSPRNEPLADVRRP